ncbi:MAG: peptide-methionine (S)-S-oxide reductase MsrA [Candidatus Gracilibacteria bacterium]|nr:peptide-methionine (S)-S-oxide reductase MsrA [Candidatus Gracilibacteria bacterium]
MKKIFNYTLLGIVSILVSYYVTMGFLQGNISQDIPEEKNNVTFTDTENTSDNLYKTIYLAGGCFWCIEGAFDEFPGVVSAVSGYAGGTQETATYKQVVQGNTLHRETVKITYIPMKTDVDTLLERYFNYIDPFDEAGQFADRGFQYTTAIFYKDEIEKKYFEKYISDNFDKPLATKLVLFSGFIEAEEEHQNYAKKQSQHYQRYYKGSGRKDYVEGKKE